MLSVYIRANNSFTLRGISDGEYIVYVALGNDWDSEAGQFTMDAEYFRFERELEFVTTEITYTDYTITLQPIEGGTATTLPLAPDQFPGSGQ